MPRGINRAGSDAICHGALSASNNRTLLSLRSEQQFPSTAVKASISLIEDNHTAEPEQGGTVPPPSWAHICPAQLSVPPLSLEVLTRALTSHTHTANPTGHTDKSWWNWRKISAFQWAVSHCASPPPQGISCQLWISCVQLAQVISLRKNNSQKCSFWGIQSVLYWKLSSSVTQGHRTGHDVCVLCIKNKLSQRGKK